MGVLGPSGRGRYLTFGLLDLLDSKYKALDYGGSSSSFSFSFRSPLFLFLHFLLYLIHLCRPYYWQYSPFPGDDRIVAHSLAPHLHLYDLNLDHTNESTSHSLSLLLRDHHTATTTPTSSHIPHLPVLFVRLLSSPPSLRLLCQARARCTFHVHASAVFYPPVSVIFLRLFSSPPFLVPLPSRAVLRVGGKVQFNHYQTPFWTVDGYLVSAIAKSESEFENDFALVVADLSDPNVYLRSLTFLLRSFPFCLREKPNRVILYLEKRI